MRTFVVGTGRCGSMTFATAMAHCTNYTVAHESRIHRVEGRLEYPDRHIEVDNRLAWFLGSLGQRFPTDVLYVHLTRDPDAVARSYAARSVTALGPARRWRAAVAFGRGYWPALLMDAFARGIVHRHRVASEAERLDAARLMVSAVNANITEFLRDRPHLRIDIAEAPDRIDELWEAIGALGDRDAARRELGRAYNASS